MVAGNKDPGNCVVDMAVQASSGCADASAKRRRKTIRLMLT